MKQLSKVNPEKRIDRLGREKSDANLTLIVSRVRSRSNDRLRRIVYTVITPVVERIPADRYNSGLIADTRDRGISRLAG